MIPKKIKHFMIFTVLILIAFVILYVTLLKVGVIKRIDKPDKPIIPPLPIASEKIPFLGIIIGVSVITIPLLFLYLVTARHKPTAYHSPEKCQDIGFKILTKHNNYPIRFENEKGTWYPPITYNLTKDPASARVICFYSEKIVSLRRKYPVDLRYIHLLDMSQRYPTHKRIWLHGVSMIHYLEKKLKMFRHERAKMDAFEFDQLPAFLQEAMGKGLGVGMGRKIEEMMLEDV